MNYYNKSNAAYDLSRFAPAEGEQNLSGRGPQKQELPELEKKELERRKAKKQAAKKNAVKPATVVKWVFVSLFVMASLASIMVGNIKITRLNDQITNAQKTLDNAESKEVSLNAKLEARMSMSKVEDYATNKLGLVKVQSYQIQYVQLTDKDRVVVNGDAGGITGFFKNLFSSVLEYFS
jgi:hypothetical protein